MSSRSPSPLSEGEIVSGDEEKAISTNTSKARNSNVNGSTRLHSGSSSRAAHNNGMYRLSNDMNFHFRDDSDGPSMMAKGRPSGGRDRSRSRSPYRANKPSSGEKRRRDDDHYNHKGGSDPRRFKVHYEDGGSRSRRPYADLDQHQSPQNQLPYDDRTGRMHRDRGRDRDRSRSPFRHDKTAPPSEQSQVGRRGNNGCPSSRGASEYPPNLSSARDASESTPQVFVGQDQAKVKMSLSQHSKTTAGRGSDTSASIVGGDASDQAGESHEPQEQLTEAELIEQRRKRREAIKARHKNTAPLLVQALEQSMPSAPATPLHDSSAGTSEQQSPPSSIGSPQTPQHGSSPSSPTAFAVDNDEDLVVRRDGDEVDEQGPSAADYDPNLDMQEDRPDHKRQDLQDAASKKPVGNDESSKPGNAPSKPKEFDMFADDDDDDMFAPADTTIKAAATGTKQARALDESLLDNWDYPDGHYRIILGELLDGRYAVQQQIGKGTFATVVRAQDTRTGNSVAIKIACNNETMYKAGQKEMDMLQLLNQQDPEDKKHIIRLLRNFDHKAHLCLVFESLNADLREVLKKFGRNVGINLKAVRSYAQQMFLSLSHLKRCSILHADLKPDNILVSEKRNLLKICDLGTAAFANDAEVTPYLVSRFYRAPEVILGMPFDYAIDMWSIGCTLFELYTGRILFAGADNNQMLRVIQECRGKFPIRMLKRSTLAEKHFDIDGNFFSQERDKITGKATLRQLNFNKIAPGKDLRSRLSGNIKGMKPEEVKEHASFVDLMDKCLQLDPARRISPNEAMRHGFITHSPDAPKAAPTVKVAMNVPRRAH